MPKVRLRRRRDRDQADGTSDGGTTVGPSDRPDDTAQRTSTLDPRSPRWRQVWAELAVVGVLGALALAFFWPLLTGHMFSTIASAQNGIYPWAASPNRFPLALQDDSATLSYGWQSYLTDALRAGSFPFWGENSFGGYAIFSNGSSGFANPTRILLALVASPVVAHELFSIVHMAAGGVLAYLLGRELRLSRSASLLVGTAWMLTSWNLGWLHLEVVSPVIAFFPAGLLLIHRTVRRANPGWAMLAGATLAWTLISAHLLFALVTFILCFVYAAALVAWPVDSSEGSPSPSRGGRAWRVALTFAISTGLAAPVLVPTWRMLANSQREALSYDVLQDRWLGDPATFLYAFVPPELPLSMDAFNAELLFSGTIVAVLALVGMFVRRSPAASLGRGLAIGLFLVIIGTPLTWIVFTFVPGMDVFRPYERLGMWWSLGLILLAGSGLDAVLTRTQRWGAWSGPLVTAVVIGFTAVQLLTFGRSLNPEFPPRDSALAFPGTPLTAAMQEASVDSTGWPARHVGVRRSQDDGWSANMLFANTNLAFDLDSITGYDSVFPDRSTDVVRVLEGESVESVLRNGLESAYVPILETGRARLDLLGRLGVSQVVLVPGLDVEDTWAEDLRDAGARVDYEGADGTLVALGEAGPRLVGGTKLVRNREESLFAFAAPSFDHTDMVVIEESEVQRLEPGTPVPLDSGSAGVVLQTERNQNNASLTVDARRPAWLVVPDGWDRGWTVTVNGDAAALLRANHSQRAVLVPAGRSEIRMEYRPDGWNLGIALCLLTIAFSTLVAVAYATRDRYRDWFPPRSHREGPAPAGSPQGSDP